MNRSILSFLVILVVAASGCISVTANAYVTSDATIEKVSYRIGIDKSTYQRMSSGEREPFSQIQNTSEGDVEAFNYSSYDMNTYEEDGMKYLEATFYDVRPTESSSIRVYEEDGEIVYEDPKFKLIKSGSSSSQGLSTGGLRQQQQFEPDVQQNVQPETGEQFEQENRDRNTTFSAYSGEGSVKTIQYSPNQFPQESQFSDNSQQPGSGTSRDSRFGDGLKSFQKRLQNSINMTYRIHMPGKIVETSGKISGGNIAVYNSTHIRNDSPDSQGAYVRSKKGSGGIIGSIVGFFTGLF